MSTAITSSAFEGGAFGGSRSIGRGAVRSAPPLRLTKRGRTVLTVVVAAPLVVAAFVFALNGGGATASLTGSDVPFTYVTVASGQSLWQLAEQVAPQADPRDVIAEIEQLNQLDGADVYAGQELAIPAQYAK